MKAKALFFLLTTAPLVADPRFAITSSTIDAGGNVAVGSRFALNGTVGQADASTPAAKTGGRFALSPGFWGYVAVNPPGESRLVIRSGGPGQVVLAWPLSVTGYTLEESPDLTPTSWRLVRTPVVDTDTEHTVTVPIDAPKKFFRLGLPN